MDEYDSLSRSKWECNYHVIFIPKYRRKALFDWPEEMSSVKGTDWK